MWLVMLQHIVSMDLNFLLMLTFALLEKKMTHLALMEYKSDIIIRYSQHLSFGNSSIVCLSY